MRALLPFMSLERAHGGYPAYLNVFSPQTESNVHEYKSAPSYKARPLHKGKEEKGDDISPKNGHLDNKLTLLLGEGWQGSRRAEAGSATLHS